MKTCKKCLVEKDLSEFYKHPKSADGHFGKSGKCSLAEAHERRNRNIDRYREADRLRKLEHGAEKVRNYRKTPQGQEATRESVAKWASNNEIKRRAHQAVKRAIVNGSLKKLNCVNCGREAEAHHEDYSKPLDVIWYCDAHHKARHRQINAEKRLAKHDQFE